MFGLFSHQIETFAFFAFIALLGTWPTLLGLWLLGRALWKGRALDVCLVIMTLIMLRIPVLSDYMLFGVALAKWPVLIAALLAWIWRINANLTEMIDTVKKMTELQQQQQQRKTIE